MFISIGISSQLKNAKEGDYYEVRGSALALLREPKASSNANVNKENIIVDLNNEKKNIQIIKTKGFLDKFYYVNLIRDGKIKAKGWIWSKAIRSYKKISKSEAFYVKPLPKYKPTDNEIKRATSSEDRIIGKWVDSDVHIGGIYIITKNNNGILLKTTFKDGSVSEEVASISKVSNGEKVDYKNNFGEYLIIYDNGNLGVCDSMGCFKSLKSIK